MDKHEKNLQQMQDRITELENQNEQLKTALKNKNNEVVRDFDLKLIKENDIRFRDIFNNVPVAYQSLDIDGRIITVNNYWLELLGYQMDEVLGKVFGDFWSDESAKYFPGVYQGFKDTCWINNAELKLKKKDGTVIDAVLTGRIQRKNENEFGQTHCIIYDISTLKDLQRNLKQNETFLLQSQDVANIGSYKFDTRTGIWESSPMLDRIFGIDQNDERTVGSWASLIHPDDRDQMTSYLANDVLANKNEFDKEYRIVNRKTGRTLYVHGKGKLVHNPFNELVSMIGTIQDITDRVKISNQLKESEQRLALALRGSNDGLWDWSIKNHTIFFSPRYLAMLGYDENELEHSVEVFNELLHPVDFIRLEDHLKEFESDLVDHFELEYRMKHKNGSWIHVLSRATKEVDNNGKISRLIGTHVDITQIRMIEKKLREANATKDKFFSIIAHDLKNPFNSLLGFSELLSDKAKQIQDSDIKKYSVLINDTVQQSYDLLINLLEWAKLQTGRVSMFPEPIVIRDLLENVNLSIAVLAKEKNIQIEKAFDDVSGLYADKKMLETVIRNLLVNAIKFSFEDSKIKISVKKTNNEVRFEVMDHGVGIKNEHIENLFKIDSSVTTLGTKREKGSGLGLILCKEFIERHNGTIGVQSIWGRGATFFFTIPLNFHSNEYEIILGHYRTLMQEIVNSLVNFIYIK